MSAPGRELMRARRHAAAPSARAAARVRARARKASGTLLAPCDDPPDSLCGSIEVPLNRSQPVGPTTPVFFSVIPHSGSGAVAGTILASAGGPGFSSSAEGFFAVPVRAAARPPGPAHDRPARHGTFGADRLCRPAARRGCAARRHRRVRAQLGAAASRFGSADRAEDIEDVRAALGIPKLDYFGPIGRWPAGAGLRRTATATGCALSCSTPPYRVGFEP